MSVTLTTNVIGTGTTAVTLANTKSLTVLNDGVPVTAVQVDNATGVPVTVTVTVRVQAP